MYSNSLTSIFTGQEINRITTNLAWGGYCLTNSESIVGGISVFSISWYINYTLLQRVLYY